MAAQEIERLIRLMGRLPGLGPRSARRAVLSLIKHPESQLAPLRTAIDECVAAIATCEICGNIDSRSPCSVCADPERDRSTICVVQEVEDLWAMDKGGRYRGLFHVLGGTLSALDGRTPEELRITSLLERALDPTCQEVVLALGATVDGQTTAHYLADRLKSADCSVSRLGQGLPMGGELNYLDDGTLEAAWAARRRFA